ncbi:hypothetical protein C8R45DRAFT_926939 [Mycena sanguinolenta]|nr:hypothetical protein C8R45DRAFT_926939 [Mycena sanguinolenta]
MTQDAVAMIAESVYLGAYGVFFGIAVYSILRKGLKSRGSIIMLVVVCYLYAASVTQWALDVTSKLRAVHALLMVPDVPIPDRGDPADAVTSLIIAPAESLFRVQCSRIVLASNSSSYVGWDSGRYSSTSRTRRDLSMPIIAISDCLPGQSG